MSTCDKMIIIYQLAYKDRVAASMINLEDHLKVKQEYEKPGHFLAKLFLANICLGPISYFEKNNYIPTSLVVT